MVHRITDLGDGIIQQTQDMKAEAECNQKVLAAEAQRIQHNVHNR
jgi:hypothetical protein